MPHDDPRKLALPDLGRRAFLRLGLLGAASLLVAPSFAQAFGFLPKRKPHPPRVLMIDPGHGGVDPGAIGITGVKEKDITLDIALHMAAILKGSHDLRVKLTRDKDVYLPLEERVKIAHDEKADLFVSVHADSAPNKNARGLSVYTLSDKASDSLADAIASQENKAGQFQGLDLSHTDKQVAAILFDLTARRTCNTSQRAKVAFVRLMKPHWQLLDNPMRSANFVVLRSPDIPSLLVETGFLSNLQDVHLLMKEAQRAKVAHLMAQKLGEILESPLFA